MNTYIISVTWRNALKRLPLLKKKRIRRSSKVVASKVRIGDDAAMSSSESEALTGAAADGPELGRSQRRLLRRIYNGRTVPIMVDGRSFLTYREASRYLLSLTDPSRENAYAQMKASATDS